MSGRSSHGPPPPPPPPPPSRAGSLSSTPAAGGRGGRGMPDGPAHRPGGGLGGGGGRDPRLSAGGPADRDRYGRQHQHEPHRGDRGGGGGGGGGDRYWRGGGGGDQPRHDPRGGDVYHRDERGGGGDAYRRDHDRGGRGIGGDRRDPFPRGGQRGEQHEQHRGGGDPFRRGGGGGGDYRDDRGGGGPPRWHPRPPAGGAAAAFSAAAPRPREWEAGAAGGYAPSAGPRWGAPPPLEAGAGGGGYSQGAAAPPPPPWGAAPFEGHHPPLRDDGGPPRAWGPDDSDRHYDRDRHPGPPQGRGHDGGSRGDAESRHCPPDPPPPPPPRDPRKGPAGATPDEEGQVAERVQNRQEQPSRGHEEPWGENRADARSSEAPGSRAKDPAATATAVSRPPPPPAGPSSAGAASSGAPDSARGADREPPSSRRPPAPGGEEEDRLAREEPGGAAAVDPPSSHKSKIPTPNPTSCFDGDALSENQHRRSSGRSAASGGSGGGGSSKKVPAQSVYGRPLEVSSTGSFPSPGATLGPWFCLGQLGKGTFSSIHRVVGLAPAGSDAAASAGAENRPTAAAKVELTSFQQSGVLEAEAAILDFLHRSLQPPARGGGSDGNVAVVPKFFGYYRCTPTAPLASSATTPGPTAGGGAFSASPDTAASALIMEYLPGQDMHQLRETVMTHPEHYANSAGKDAQQRDHHQHHHGSTRRIELADAVYLTADVMLPLLRRLHSVGVVHRDVKPSNCVLRREKSKQEGGGGEFCMVDFGLSKSIIVPEDSPHADKEHYWPESSPWQKPINYTRRGCYRVAREKAEFRGTSMYASLRVHQLRDYCARDDMWSLLYVFCDLVSGGLPWMQQAANRDRIECQRIKEMVHGDGETYETDQTELLLMGDCYHVAKFRKDRYEAAAEVAESSGSQPPAPPTKSIDLPPPLALSQDPRLVSLLRDVFTHLAKLEFWETPDYDLIQRNIRGFRDTDVRTPLLPRISYEMSVSDRGMHKSNLLDSRRNMPRGSLPEDTDPMASDIFENVEDSSEAAKSSDDRLRQLPLELRYRIALMEYHASRPDAVPRTLALRDWLKATLPLLYGEWDTPKYEGRHRTSTDGLKRELYLELLERCLRWASVFDFFTSKSCYAADATKMRLLGSRRKSSAGDDPVPRNSKQRRIDPLAATFIAVSRALFGLRLAIQAERGKKSGAQATRINFS